MHGLGDGGMGKQGERKAFFTSFALRKVFSRYYSFKVEKLITYGGSICMLVGYHT
jgi:hypothetical protein